MLFRFIFSVLVFYLSLFYPGIVFLIIGGIGVFVFESYYEFLIASFLIDILYGFPVEGFYGFRFIFFSISLLLFFTSKMIRRKIRFFEAK